MSAGRPAMGLKVRLAKRLVRAIGADPQERLPVCSADERGRRLLDDGRLIRGAADSPNNQLKDVSRKPLTMLLH